MFFATVDRLSGLKIVSHLFLFITPKIVFTSTDKTILLQQQYPNDFSKLLLIQLWLFVKTLRSVLK